jgi:hypothetical protein
MTPPLDELVLLVATVAFGLLALAVAYAVWI